MSLIQRVQDILLKPKETWPIIAAEGGDTTSIYRDYLIFLAAIPAIASFIGLSLIGAGGFGFSVRVPIMSGLVQMVVGFVLSLVMVFVLALIVDALAPTFNGNKSQISALKLVAYGSTAGFVGGIFGLIPSLSILGLIAGLYSIYLIYTGVPVMMKCPPEKAGAYTAVVVVCGIVAAVILGAVSAVFMPSAGMRMGAGMGAGAIGGNDTNVTITTPGGGEMKIDTAKMEAMAKQMEEATQRAFCATPAAMQTQAALPEWSLLEDEHAVLCVSGRLEFDLGAIGKGFALDRMAELLRDWECPAFLLVSGGSSILTGDSPSNALGWSCGLGDDDSPHRVLLTHASLSGSGLAVKGAHILDPRTGQPAPRQLRAWILADTAAESDALSTACMVLTEKELATMLDQNHSWLAFLDSEGGPRPIGRRPMPQQA